MSDKIALNNALIDAIISRDYSRIKELAKKAAYPTSQGVVIELLFNLADRHFNDTGQKLECSMRQRGGIMYLACRKALKKAMPKTKKLDDDMGYCRFAWGMPKELTLKLPEEENNETSTLASIDGFSEFP